MKVLIVLMCAVIAIQARSTAVSQSTRSVAALGENPWMVHIRIAVAASGLLDTCAATLIGPSWALTAKDCVYYSRYIWMRYASLNLIIAELVTENSLRVFPNVARDVANNVALININRFIHFTANISPVALRTSEVKELNSARFCTFNDPDSDLPGELLTCGDVELVVGNEDITVDTNASRFDLGAGLVSEGVQLGVLVATEGGITTFARVEPYLEWIEAETGLDLSPRVPAVVA